MQEDNKNLIMAIVLSVAIIIIWQFFIAQPQLEKQRLQQQREQARQSQQNPAEKTAPGPVPGTKPAPVPGVVPGGNQAVQPVELVLAQTPRLEISTPRLKGTINLVGARFDDLHLKDYRETVEPGSPIITLMAPSGTRHGYFAEQGWTAPAGSNIKVPGSKTLWTVKGNRTLSDKTPVTLEWDNGEGVIFTRTISVDDKYLFTIRQTVTNNSGKPIALFAFSRVQRQEIPKLQGVFVIHEGLVGVIDDVVQELKYKTAKDDNEKIEGKSTGGWVGITDKYWAVTAIPDQNSKFQASMRYTPLAGRDAFQADFFVTDPKTIAPGKTASYESRLFAGAKVVKILNGYMDRYKIVRFGNLVDWGWFYFITRPMFWLLDLIYSFVGNFGVAILLITVIVKAAFFPLANKSYKSMAQMKKLQPQMQQLKERYGDDKAEMQKKIMELYKKEKVSPLSGCLPVLLQIPVFFSLYKVLFVTIEMRHAPFILWIKDLSAPDPTSVFNLFGLLPFTPPSVLMIGVLPLLMGITMWIQMKLNPAPPDPVQAQLFNIMPIAFTFMLGTFPAGLVLYWAWNNLLGIIQQYTIMKRTGIKVNLMQNIKDSLPKFGRGKAGS